MDIDVETETDKTTVTWAVVNYHSREVVLSFISELVNHFRDTDLELRIVVGDNSKEPEISVEDLRGICGAHEFVLRHDMANRGYLPGALDALDLLPTPLDDWVVVSNCDLAFNSSPAAWFEKLGSRPSDDGGVVVAPQVKCLETGVMLNPHLEVRPSSSAIFARWALTRSRVGFRLMETRSIRRRRHKAQSDQPVGAHEGDKFYAAHGSIWIMSGKALSVLRPKIRDTPLYAEEIAVGEGCRLNGIPVVFEPDFLLEHEPHTSTGQASTRARANKWKIAYSDIVRHYV